MIWRALRRAFRRGPRLKTLVINRDKDVGRLAYVKGQVAKHPALSLERFAAIDAFEPDFSVAKSLPPGIHFDSPLPENLKKRGMIGCVLSHAHCWHIAAEGNEPVLILEDDAKLTKHVAAMVGHIFALDSFDIVFVNERMQRYRALLDKTQFRGHLLKVDDFCRAMMEEYPAEAFETPRLSPDAVLPGAPGGDGYVVSPAGARKMLDNFARFKMLQHADWLLFAFGVSEMLDGGPQRLRALNRQMRGRIAVPDAYILGQAAVSHGSKEVGGSVRGRTEIGQ